MKTIQFTHTDLDGISCGIVAKLFFPNVKTYYCDYNNVDSTIEEVVGKQKRKCRIIISDLSYKENRIDITNLLLSMGHHVIIADHHVTSEWVNNYFKKNGNWCLAKEGKYCGAVLLYKLLSSWLATPLSTSGYRTPSFRINRFLKYVNQWDTWTWVKPENFKEKLFDNMPLVLSNASGMLDEKTFTKQIIDYFSGKQNWFLNDALRRKLEKHNKRQEKIISDVINNRKTVSISTNAYGTINGMYLKDEDHFQSIIAQIASKLMEPYDKFILIEEPDSMSLRFPKGGIELSTIAKELGGGGHPYAAGFTRNEENEKLISVETKKRDA